MRSNFGARILRAHALPPGFPLFDETIHVSVSPSFRRPVVVHLHQRRGQFRSDRSRDQGRTPEKFAWLESLGFTLFPQDGSGIVSAEQVLVASAAVEDTVPEVVRARDLGCARMSRAELLATLFNAAPHGIAIGGTAWWWMGRNGVEHYNPFIKRYCGGVALLFALTFFVSLIVWFFFHDRTRIEAYAQAPLEHDTCEQRDALHTHTTTF